MTASTNFDKLCLYLAKGEVSFSANPFNFILVTVAPDAYNLVMWGVRANVSNECPSSGSYISGVGGSTTPVVALDTANHWATVTFTNPEAFTGATLSAVGAIIFMNTGDAETDKLISYVDFNGTVASTLGTFTTTFGTPLKIVR